MTGPADDARRAELVALAGDASAAVAFAVIAAECMAHWRANVAGVVERRDVESLHQTRVGVRRLRSAYSLFGRTLRREPEFVATAAELRLRALPLGRARDLDVILAAPFVRGLDEAATTGLRGLREASYDEVIDLLTGPPWLSLADRVDTFLGGPPWSLAVDPPVSTVAPAALERRWARVVRRGTRLREASAAARHTVRIEAKKLRYGAQFFASLYAAPSRYGAPGRPDPLAFAETVAALQDALGELNDVATARTVLAEVGGGVGTARPQPAEHDLLEAAVQAWAQVAALEPFWR